MNNLISSELNGKSAVVELNNWAYLEFLSLLHLETFNKKKVFKIVRTYRPLATLLSYDEGKH